MRAEWTARDAVQGYGKRGEPQRGERGDEEGRGTKCERVRGCSDGSTCAEDVLDEGEAKGKWRPTRGRNETAKPHRQWSPYVSLSQPSSQPSSQLPGSRFVGLEDHRMHTYFSHFLPISYGPACPDTPSSLPGCQSVLFPPSRFVAPRSGGVRRAECSGMEAVVAGKPSRLVLSAGRGAATRFLFFWLHCNLCGELAPKARCLPNSLTMGGINCLPTEQLITFTSTHFVTHSPAGRRQVTMRLTTAVQK